MPATIIIPGPSRGQRAPYGFADKQTLTTGSVIFGVPSDVSQIGVQVYTSSGGSYFLEATLNPYDDITNDEATWYDLVGDGETAQNTPNQAIFDGAVSAIRVRNVGGAQTVCVEMRRVG